MITVKGNVSVSDLSHGFNHAYFCLGHSYDATLDVVNLSSPISRLQMDVILFPCGSHVKRWCPITDEAAPDQ